MLFASLALLLTPLAAAAQHPLMGRVLDPDGAPIPGATVEVEGTLIQGITGPDGRFRLSLAPGTWTLTASGIGYTEMTVTVRVGAELVPSVELRLEPRPIALRGLTVEGRARPELSRTVTPQTIRQVPPLGEPDVFRAVVLLPVVSQPNDLKGRIHLAGGSSDETGVTLDGHPLQDPFHLLGLFGAFNVAALDRADVRIHHLPPSAGGRLSGSVDLTTRLPEDHAAGDAMLGLLSSGGTVAAPLVGSVDVLAAGRITYLDKFIGGLSVQDLPRYGYEDLLLRLGAGTDWRVETLAFHTRDHVRAAGDSLSLEPFHWGETLVGARLDGGGGPYRLKARVSLDAAVAGLDRPETETAAARFIDIRRDWWSGAVELARRTARTRLAAGASLDRRRHEQAWDVGGDADEIFSAHMPAVFADTTALAVGAAWADARFAPWAAWRLDAGLRLLHPFSDDTDAPALRLAPRVDIRFAPDAAWSLEAAFDRRYQFDAQLEEPVAGSISPPLFLLPDGRRADVLGLAATRSFQGAGGRLRAEAFYKRYPDRPVQWSVAYRGSAAPGDIVVIPSFPSFVRVPARAWGLALSGRVEPGAGILVQGSYTFQRVLEEFDDGVSPTTWDAPHTVLLFTSVPVGRGWVFNLAYHGHSGRATTPVSGVTFVPAGPANNGYLMPRYILADRNSARVDPYHRVDLGVRKTWEGWGADWALSFQVLNLLNLDNPIEFDWARYFNQVRFGGFRLDATEHGLPILPSIALEASW